MIEKGDTIIIEEIGNGIMLRPSMTTPTNNKDILAFNKQESFLRWIKNYFNFVKNEEDEP